MGIAPDAPPSAFGLLTRMPTRAQPAACRVESAQKRRVAVHTADAPARCNRRLQTHNLPSPYRLGIRSNANLATPTLALSCRATFYCTHAHGRAGVRARTRRARARGSDSVAARLRGYARSHAARRAAPGAARRVGIVGCAHAAARQRGRRATRLGWRPSSPRRAPSAGTAGRCAASHRIAAARRAAPRTCAQPRGPESRGRHFRKHVAARSVAQREPSAARGGRSMRI
jgi:hypothetical protein